VTSENVRIRVLMTPADTKQINNTLAQVFERGQLLDRVAAYWKPLTNDLKEFHKSAPNEAVGVLEGNRSVYLFSRGVIEPPRAIHTPDPEYTDTARSKRLEGTTLLSVIVNEKGFPEMLQIVRGLGEGLDIQALVAVASWRFHPALKNGQPVAMLIDVEVTFKMG
jgi:TonB family protein